MDEIYKRIEDLCIHAGVNITSMCKEAGVPRSALSDYKAGRIKSLSADKLQKIAAYFGVSVDYLLGNEEKPLINEDEELTEYLEELKNRDEMRMLFSLTKGATKEDVEKAVRVIEAMLGK